MPFTTRGLARILDAYFRRQVTRPLYFYIALVIEEDDSPVVNVAPTPATKVFSELIEIAAGNGYSLGGYQLNTNATDFDSLTEDDTDEITELSIKNVLWVASGGNIPASGDPARYCVLLASESSSPEAISGREVIWFESLGREITVLSGQTLQLTGLDIRIKGGSMIKSNIIRGAITITNGNTTNTATISAVDPDRTEVSHGGVIAPAQDAASTNVLLTLTNATTVTAERGGSSGNVTVRFQIKENW